MRFVELPFPQMADALLSEARRRGVECRAVHDRSWSSPATRASSSIRTRRTIRAWTSPAFYARDSWLKSNRDVALRFKRAMDKATRYLNDAPKEERDNMDFEVFRRED